MAHSDKGATILQCVIKFENQLLRTLHYMKFISFSREGVRIPLLVTTCVAEVERRGLRDLGIYRVSGLSSEIQKLKKAFEKSKFCLENRSG